MNKIDRKKHLGEIQSQFPVMRLKFGVRRKTDKFETVPEELPRISLDMIESWTGKVIEKSEEETTISTGLVEFQAGDVLFNKLRPYLAKAFEADHSGAGSPEFLVLKPTRFNSRFLLYLLLSDEFIERVDASTYGAKMPRASWDFIGNLSVPCPDERKQESIADFLDNRTTRIDTLIQKNKRLLEKLEEKRSALVEISVTEGINEQEFEPNERLEVLEKHPAGWNVQRAKTVFNERDERGYEDLPLLEVSLNTGVRLREENEDRNAWVASDLGTMKRVAPGDLVFNKMRLWQGAVDKSDYEGLVSPDYTVIEPLSKANPEYYAYLLRTEAYKTEIYRRSYGIVDDRLRIYWTQFGDMPLLHPSPAEQTEIVQHIRESSKEIDKLRTKLQTSIDLLEEKRQALITAAVTGQIDLSDWDSQEDQELPA